MSGYTKVDNWLFDIVMPNAKPSTYKVVCAVIRCTAGWNKDSDVISLSQFQKLTGIANRTNLSNAIQDAIDCGYISRQSSGNSFVYSANASTESVPPASTESVPVKPKQYQNSTSTSTESVPFASTESVHTKEHSKDIEIQQPQPDPVNELAGHFTNISGLFPKNGSYQDEWELPLTVILNGAGDLETAKSKISAAVELARGKGFRLASPRSITNIIANMPAGAAAANGAIKVRGI